MRGWKEDLLTVVIGIPFYVVVFTVLAWVVKTIAVFVWGVLP